MNSAVKAIKATPWSGFFLVGVIVVILLHPFLAWFGPYDGARVAQLLLLACVVFLIFFARLPERVSVPVALFLFLFLGLLSAYMSARPEWAVLEVVRFFLLFVLAFYTSMHHKYAVQGVLIGAVLVISELLVAVTSLVLSGVQLKLPQISPFFAQGFSNIRHYEEVFVAATLFCFCYFYLRKNPWSMIFLSSSLVVIYFGGARASTLGLVSALVVIGFIVRRSYQNYLLHILGAMLLASLCIIILHWLIVDDSESYLRLARVSDSGRFELWQKAFELWLESPLLGIGPMHYAYWSGLDYAHPHSIVFQIGPEWGILASLSLAFLLFRFFAACLRSLQLDDAVRSRSALAPAMVTLLAMLITSLFGGTFVTPVSETVFFFILGIAISFLKCREWSFLWCNVSAAFLRALSLIALIVMIACLSLTHGERMDRDQPRGAAVDAPRFWQNGGLILQR